MAETKEGTPITYTAVLTPGEDGWICAQVAEVPEAISQGRTLEEAEAMSPRRSSWRSSGAATRGNHCLRRPR